MTIAQHDERDQVQPVAPEALAERWPRAGEPIGRRQIGRHEIGHPDRLGHGRLGCGVLSQRDQSLAGRGAGRTAGRASATTSESPKITIDTALA